ncbi:single-stranded DNA-binding protein [Treponema parvum]|uniref:Single-stranded DNA-binding protein n=1 Tax=Treponema parvum TaxID=138851 RepID=A0A975IF79_9SPIR|nr:single-stranded DNA-binding protein [Treponema parvum]QTQ11788.1 single-stranded DNA-binding protein [Treponema parvum]QTQ14054.1 single-stranded DNA-binding protein [Treponema parvum]QTQ16244.1 single-stranded DNA-binding protein [Treponema parvum]
MTDLNHVTIIGRLTRDVGTDERSFGYLPSGQARANVSLAVNRSRKNGDQWVDEVSYFDVTIWGKQAESLKPYLTKGKQIAVEGYLRQDRWEKDGQKNSRVTITATNVQLLGGKTESNQQSGGYVPKFQPKQDTMQDNNMDSFGTDASAFPEDIPF